MHIYILLWIILFDYLWMIVERYGEWNSYIEAFVMLRIISHPDQIVNTQILYPQIPNTVYHISIKLSNTVYQFAPIWHIKTYNNIPNLG
jgi:hypothetical protein